MATLEIRAPEAAPKEIADALEAYARGVLDDSDLPPGATATLDMETRQMTVHVPAPKHVVCEPSGRWLRAEPHERGNPEFGIAAYVHVDAYESERALNAELVEALKAASAVTALAGWRDSPNEDARAAYVKIHAALAKAEAREKGDG